GVHALGVVPLPGDGGSDVGLVLVVGRDDLDLQVALGLLLEVLDRELGGHHRALPGNVRVQARHVVEHADLDDAARDLRAGRPRDGGQGCADERCSELGFHLTPPPMTRNWPDTDAGPSRTRLTRLDCPLAQTPRYWCSISCFCSSSRAAKPSTIRPCSMT